MTKNQRLVLRWFESNCNNSGVIKVGIVEIGQIFHWSHQYTHKILNQLISKGCLEELQKGTGRRVTKYLVVSSSCNQGASSCNQKEVPHHVPSHNQNGTSLLSSNKTRTLFGQREYARSSTHTRGEYIFENAARPLKHVKTNSNPFSRFKSRWETPDKWNATDFVCYYSFVHKVRFGDNPVLNWPVECGAARTLLRRLKTPEQFKVFIQVAFGISTRKPNGLRSFVYDYFYTKVVDTREDVIDTFMDEYDDEQVFPWLKQEVVRRSHVAAVEYQKNLVLRGLGLYK